MTTIWTTRWIFCMLSNKSSNQQRARVYKWLTLNHLNLENGNWAASTQVNGLRSMVVIYFFYQTIMVRSQRYGQKNMIIKWSITLFRTIWENWINRVIQASKFMYIHREASIRTHRSINKHIYWLTSHSSAHRKAGRQWIFQWMQIS